MRYLYVNCGNNNTSSNTFNGHYYWQAGHRFLILPLILFICPSYLSIMPLFLTCFLYLTVLLAYFFVFWLLFLLILLLLHLFIHDIVCSFPFSYAYVSWFISFLQIIRANKSLDLIFRIYLLQLDDCLFSWGAKKRASNEKQALPKGS